MKSTTKLQHAAVNAFNGTHELRAALKAFGASARSEAVRTKLAHAVVGAANAFHKLKGAKAMVVYAGQRGVAFGVPYDVKTTEGDKTIITVKYERTDIAKAVRMWFDRAIEGKAHKPAKVKAVKGWAGVAAKIVSINELKRQLSPENRVALAKALAGVYAKFEAKIEA